VVRTNVPPIPLAYTTSELTGLIAWSLFVVPLCCTRRVGPRFCSADDSGATGEVGSGDEESAQDRAAAATSMAAAAISKGSEAWDFSG
jgi:hypothetical protein